ncbi:MAG: endolytic transglycosylase MltG [Bacteroidales bacterium]|nr:endolytic transglycosylase MltG [Bacteroidales bacterium]
MKKALIIIFSTLAILFIFLFGVGTYLNTRPPVIPEFKDDLTVYIQPHTEIGVVLDSIYTSVKHPARARAAVKRVGLSQSNIKPGKYTFDKKSSVYSAVSKIKFGKETPTKLTFSGTIRSKQKIAQRISRQMMVDSLTVINALRDPEFCGKYGFDTLTIFAMILPDTYYMFWSSSVDQIFDRLKKEYDTYWTDERKQLAAKQSLSPLQVSILASIVDQETRKKDDYPRIAAVYLNRLRKGMKLQACPTINYCFGYTLPHMYTRYTKVDSPFNTYLHYGLPPAPISVPPKACIEAVLHPEKTDYLFFCASPNFDGTHRFATTYAEHARNSREYDKALVVYLAEKKKKQAATGK